KRERRIPTFSSPRLPSTSGARWRRWPPIRTSLRRPVASSPPGTSRRSTGSPTPTAAGPIGEDTSRKSTGACTRPATRRSTPIGREDRSTPCTPTGPRGLSGPDEVDESPLEVGPDELDPQLLSDGDPFEAMDQLALHGRMQRAHPGSLLRGAGHHRV